MNDLIYKYLSGLLSETEQAAFEETLKSDDVLRAELEQTRAALSQLKQNGVPAEDSAYLERTISRFRAKIASPPKPLLKRIPAWVYPAAAVPLLLLIFYYVFITPNNGNIAPDNPVIAEQKANDTLSVPNPDSIKTRTVLPPAEEKLFSKTAPIIESYDSLDTRTLPATETETAALTPVHDEYDDLLKDLSEAEYDTLYAQLLSEPIWE